MAVKFDALLGKLREKDITDISNYVPYTGATTNVNLGIYDLIANRILLGGATDDGVSMLQVKGSSSGGLIATGTAFSSFQNPSFYFDFDDDLIPIPVPSGDLAGLGYSVKFTSGAYSGNTYTISYAGDLSSWNSKDYFFINTEISLSGGETFEVYLTVTYDNILNLNNDNGVSVKIGGAGVLTGTTGLISMWTNDGGYLTAEADPLSWLKYIAQTGLTGNKSGSFNLLTTGTLGAGAITGTSLTDSGLTIEYVPYANTGGLLANSPIKIQAAQIIPERTIKTGYPIYIGDTASAADFTGRFGIWSDTIAQMDMAMYGGATAKALTSYWKARGTKLAKTIVVNGDCLGGLMWRTWDTSTWGAGGHVGAYADGVVSSGVYPTRIEFETTTTNSNARVTRLTIKSDGEIQIPADYVSGAAGCFSFGAAQDANIGYDGTNFCINTAVVGTGTIKINGTVAVADGTYNTGVGPLGNMGTITTKGGIITVITQAT